MNRLGKVRAALVRDIGNIGEIDARCFPRKPELGNWRSLAWLDPKFITSICAGTVCDCRMIVVEDSSGVPAGYLIYSSRNDITFGGGKILIIHRIAVLPSCRRCGLGTALVDRIINKTSKKGWSGIDVSFEDGYPELGSLLLRCGFRPLVASTCEGVNKFRWKLRGEVPDLETIPGEHIDWTF